MTKEKKDPCYCIEIKYDDSVQNDDLSDDEFIDERFDCQIRNYEFDGIENLSSTSYEFSSDDNGNINENFFAKF